MRKMTIPVLLLVCGLVTGCSREKKPSQGAFVDGTGNILRNASFEQSASGWTWPEWSSVWGPFIITDKKAHSGQKCAHLKFDEKSGKPPRKIRGVVQAATPEKFPKLASGWYRVENWNRGVRRQYLQFVVIAWEKFKSFGNYQLRYVLAGTAKPPMKVANAKYCVLSKTPDPVTGEWIHFEIPIREDFQRLWGRIPESYEKIDFLWEARFDDPLKESEHVRADVYFDDLYVGDG